MNIARHPDALPSRRHFLRRGLHLAAGAALGPLIASSARTQGNQPTPSNRVTLGCIGLGTRGIQNLESFLSQLDCQVVAVCDVDQDHASLARSLVNRLYGNEDCVAYADFRELIERRDLDAVSLALPNHWHAIPAIEAVKRGKDVYAETPLAHSVREGRAICDAVQRYGRIWQTGSWQRADERFRHAVELVLNQRIGRLHTVEVGLPSGHPDLAGTAGQESPTPPPAGLDYDRWLGPALWAPYCPARVHGNWRWQLDYGGGQLMDWVGHHVDIAHWGMDCDRSGPLEIEGQGDYPVSGLWNAPTRCRLTLAYPNNITMILAAGYPHIRIGVRWIGDQGWVRVDRDLIEANPQSLLEEPVAPWEINLPRSPGHHRSFLDSVKSRQPLLASAETAQRSATVGHLALIAMQLGRKIRWNPLREEVVEDATADRLLGRAYREPWRL